MTKRCLILLNILIVFTLRGHSQVIINDDRLRASVRQYGQAEVTIPFTNNNSLDDLTRNISILSVRNKTVYISISPLTVEWFILQKFNYSIKERDDSKGVISAPGIKQAMEWDKYPTYSQYDSIMQSFTKSYPNLCHLDTIGTSINGKLVLALKISDNAAKDENEPEVFYTSTIHGDETGGFVLMLRFADYLLKNYTLNNRVKNLVDSLEIWINPLANPDGTYKTGNAISSPVRFNAMGVDLNRNFPDPLQPLEIQQKENRDMIKFMSRHKFVLSANFHSGAEVVNYPWDRWSWLHADNDWFYIISRAYADTVHNHSVPGYMIDLKNGITDGYEWYPVYGGRQDYMTSELHGREVTIELDGNYFVTPASNLNALWQYNWRSLLGYLENALYGIHGVVRNVNTSAPVAAKVSITGHDKDNSQVYSDSLTGSFVRLLAPGLWDLTFSARGFHSTTISNIVAVTGQKQNMIVNLLPLIDSIDSTNPGTPVLYPNPAITEINADLPEKILGKVQVRIITMSGNLVYDYNTEAISGIPVTIDIMRLAAGTYSVVFTNISTKSSCSGKFVVIEF
jgi:murein tripeptide amidase MpaA